MNRPDAVGHLLEANGVWVQRLGDEEQLVLEPERPGVRDALDEEVARILDGRRRPGIRTARGPIARRGRRAVEELVGPLGVVVRIASGSPCSRNNRSNKP